MKRCVWLGLFFAFFLLLPGLNDAQAQEKTLYWQRYDVNLDVQTNSDILVEETQQIVFTSGTFTFGFAAIPLDRVEQITDLQLSEIINGSERPYTPNSTGEYGFTTSVNEGDLVITWYFPPTSNSEHTYVLRYRVIGGLRIYPEGDQIWWYAIPPDHNFPVRESRVTVTLPQTFPKDQLTVASYGAPADISYTDRGQVVFTAQDIPPDQELEVRVQFPHGVVQGSPPAWQAADDQQRQWGPVVGVIFGGLGLVILLGGPLLVYLLWYKRGRDLPAGVVPEYISEPPGDLPAPIAGALIDEKADLQDIIATITDLGRRGVLRMEEEQKEGFLGIGSGRDYIFHLEDEGKATRSYEQSLLKGIFSNGTERRMADLRQRFYTYIPTLQGELYDELVRAGFFPSNPNATRRNWLGLGIVLLIISFVVACGLLTVLGDYSTLAICPGLALIATALGLIFVAPHMPRKTAKGAEEAAKWLAFKRYLQTIEKHGDMAEVKDKFEQFLPYGIAFGLERSLINKFKAVDAPAPSWWGPVILPRYGYGYPHSGGTVGGPSAGPAGGPPGPLAGEGGLPGLAGMSEGVGASLASMSEGLGAMLSSASSTLVSTPPAQTSSSGGGWSGGGFSGGGFSGGGGGGGGSRGFG
jgi:uncharacterized membrane protein YgcG